MRFVLCHGTQVLSTCVVAHAAVGMGVWHGCSGEGWGVACGLQGAILWLRGGALCMHGQLWMCCKLHCAE